MQHDVPLADLTRLAPGEWFNDTIVNYYCQQQLAKSYPQHHFFSSFFYEKLLCLATWTDQERWDSQVDLSRKELLFLPINAAKHWTLLVCDLKQQRFEYYDSLYHARGPEVVKVRVTCVYLTSPPQSVVAVLGSFFQKRGLPQVTHWPVLEPSSRPMQSNATDCGVYLCLYATQRCTSATFVDKLHFETTKFRADLRRVLLDAV